MSFDRLGRRGGWVLVFALAIAAVLGSLGGTAAQPAKKPSDKKLPIPDKKAQQTAATLIGDLYRNELIKSLTDNDARLKLAQTLLFEARDTSDDAAGKYMLLSEAAQLAERPLEPEEYEAIQVLGGRLGLSSTEADQAIEDTDPEAGGLAVCPHCGAPLTATPSV